MKFYSVFLSVMLVITISTQAPHEMYKKTFDYLVFRQTWPKTSCMFPEGRECLIDDNINTWVIHGLWPNYDYGYPSYCDRSDKFDKGEIEPLTDILEEFWPNLFTDSAWYSFWKHEWEKHGTCALSMDSVNDQNDYFLLTLNLREKFSFGDILSRASIVPHETRTYTYSDIKEAIRSELNFSPMIYCYHNNGKQYLYEMHICLNKELEVIDCNTQRDIGQRGSGQCSTKKPLYYPILR